MIFARALGDALRHLLATDDRVVVLGEDVADPYGGAFKVTRGLSTDFPDRVRTTPVSEQALVGISAGLALEGFRPIAEIMFGDFVTLGFDQIVNHIAKYDAMYAGGVPCPVIVRVPSGGGRGYGPTHSQSLEKHFLGVPHLRVVAASLFHDPREVLSTMLTWEEPSLYVEHKLLYPQHLIELDNGRAGSCLASKFSLPGSVPSIRLSMVPPDRCTVTLVAYGHQAGVAQSVIEELAIEDEVFVELIVPGQLSPMLYEPIVASANRTGVVVTVEEGMPGNSWGTEVAATVHRECFGRLRRPVTVATSDGSVIPTAKRLESRMLMGAERIRTAILEAIR